MSKNYTVRKYQAKDVEQIIDLIIMFLNEEREEGYSNYFSGIDFNYEKVYSQLMNDVNNPLFFGQIAYSENGEIIGCFGADLVEYTFSRQTLAKDRLFYVRPGFINLGAIFDMLEAYREWAISMGANEIQIANSSGFKQRGFTVLATRAGFKQFEIGYSMRLA